MHSNPYNPIVFNPHQIYLKDGQRLEFCKDKGSHLPGNWSVLHATSLLQYKNSIFYLSPINISSLLKTTPVSFSIILLYYLPYLPDCVLYKEHICDAIIFFGIFLPHTSYNPTMLIQLPCARSPSPRRKQSNILFKAKGESFSILPLNRYIFDSMYTCRKINQTGG